MSERRDKRRSIHLWSLWISGFHFLGIFVIENVEYILVFVFLLFDDRETIDLHFELPPCVYSFDCLPFELKVERVFVDW